MPGFRLPPQPEAQKVRPIGKQSKRVKDSEYLDFIRTLPCIVTGRHPVDAAHISYAEPRAGKAGRGLGRKESDCWAVPLHPDEHRRQHSMNERDYWRSVGIDPLPIAAFLHIAFPNRERALLIINNVKQGQVRQPAFNATTGECA